MSRHPSLGQRETPPCDSPSACPWGLAPRRHTAWDRRVHRAGEASGQSHKAVTASGDRGVRLFWQHPRRNREDDTVGRDRVLPASRATSVLDSGATNHIAARDKGFTIKATGSGAKVTLADGHKVFIKGHSYVSMDVEKGDSTARIVPHEAIRGPNLTENLLSVRAVDRRGSAVVFVGDDCYILSDGKAVLASRVLGSLSVSGSVNEYESYVLKVTQVTASESAASARMEGKAELRNRQFYHLSFENLKRVVGIVYGMPLTVAEAKRVPGTAPRVRGESVWRVRPPRW